MAPIQILAQNRNTIAKAVADDNLSLATQLAVGFHCLLRAGELLAMRFGDIEISDECAIISLQASKSGLRTGTMEAVAVSRR